MAKREIPDVLVVADIGGTNARLRLYDVSGTDVLHEATFRSTDAPALEPLVSSYLEQRRVRGVAAVFGVAGPVANGAAKVTNLSWLLEEKRLSRQLGIARVQLVNDMAAIAIGCTRLPKKDLQILSRGKRVKSGNVAVIAAGTGLGEALLVWDGERLVPCSSEGGHADFAPTTLIEVQLLTYLQGRNHAHVSYERVVSGPGLGTLYDFVKSRGELAEDAAITRSLSRPNADRNAAIGALALSGKSLIASEAVQLFISVYGAEAGNLALKGLTLGGVYLTGRIARELLPSNGRVFLESMRNKGRMKALLSKVPVWIVREEQVGLVGSAYLAARLLRS